MAEGTKIVYYIGDEQTPYVSKINIPSSVITLGDFKEAIKKPNHKYFFRSKDAEFGVVKEEFTNDESHLPLCEGRIVGWLVAPDVDNFSQESGSVNSLPQQQQQQQQQQPPSVLPGNEPRPQSFMRNGMGQRDSDAESVISHHRPPHRLYDRYGGSQSTLMSSDLSTTSWDSREDTMSEYSTCTDMTASSRYHKQRQKKRYKKKRPRPGSDTTSNYSSSVTDSSMSLNIVVVTLNMEKYRFLGISIVGQSNDKGDGGIYIGSIMKGGAVAADGRIEPGDMLLQVNEKNFENMSNEEAVRVLRNIVHEPGPIHLTVAKCWDPTPESMFIIPKDEPVRPIDPAAWANHTMAVRDQYGGDYPGPSPSYGVNLEASSDTLANSLPESERYDIPLSIRTTMAVVVKHLKMPDSGLDVKTRMWLKITIPNAFIGSDLVEWLHQKVDGLQERRDARKYASNLLKAGYIRHTVNKITFSEQCYYVFGDHTVPMHQDMANLSLGDSNSDRDSDVLGPLPMHNKHQWGVAGGSSHGYPSYNNQQQSYHPYNPSPQLSRGSGDFVAPPPAYSCISGQSDNSDVMSIHSANGLMMHRAPSDLSLTRQHLATFDGGSGSGSDNLSESRYSSRSGRSGGSNHRTQRSHSGSEKDTQSQMSYNMGGSNSGSLRRIKNQGSMTLERPRPPMPLPRSSSQRSTTSDLVPVNPYHPSMQNVNPPGVLPSSNHSNRSLNVNQLPPENNQMNGSNNRPPLPNYPMQRPNTIQAPPNGQNINAPLNNQQGRPLNQVPQGLSNSQQSFQQAMGNPCDYFVGVM